MRSLFRKLPSLPRLAAELYQNKREYVLFIGSLLLAGTVAIVSLSFFISIADDLYGPGFQAFDKNAFDILHSLRSPTLTLFFTIITNLGSAPAYFTLIPIIGLILYYRGFRWSTSVQSSIVLISSFLLNVALKHFVARPRPVNALRLVEASSYSFPSGHAMSAMALYGFLIYLCYRNLPFGLFRAIAVSSLSVLILMIGTSRVYLGVHYASDVLAGFVVGLFWLMTCIIIIRSVEFYRKSKSLAEGQPK
ncbi:MAG: phosphatase PAP2 family protein [Bacteroidota bacterium]